MPPSLGKSTRPLPAIVICDLSGERVQIELMSAWYASPNSLSQGSSMWYAKGVAPVLTMCAATTTPGMRIAMRSIVVESALKKQTSSLVERGSSVAAKLCTAQIDSLLIINVDLACPCASCFGRSVRWYVLKGVQVADAFRFVQPASL